MRSVIFSQCRDRIINTFVQRHKVVTSEALCMASFIFAHKPRLLEVAAQLKRSAHAALGLAKNCAQ